MSSFDLTLESWIPVLDAGTDLRTAPDADVTFREIGLREALIRAHEIREVYCDSPVETISINRLLLALFIDALSPDINQDAWIAQWEKGYFDEGALDSYLSRPDVAGRFDLLHPTHPFYQHPEPHPGNTNIKPVSGLFLARAGGANATLFDHTLECRKEPIILPEAARGLIASQNSSLGGGNSKPFNFSQAPLLSGAVFWLRGRSLFEALLLNAPPDAKARMEEEDSFDQLLKRPPIWRRNPPEEYEKRPVEGYLDYLTWPARRVTLTVGEKEGEGIFASGLYLTQGDKDDPVVNDPLMAKKENRKTKEIYTFKFREGRALWRDAEILFKIFGRDGWGSPQTFNWLRNQARRISRKENWESYIEKVDVFGLKTEKGKVGKVSFWRHERFPLALGLIDNPSKYIILQKALSFAEQQHKSLHDAAKELAENLLRGTKGGDDQPTKADPKDVNNLIDSLDLESRYWSLLEIPFTHFLEQLNKTHVEDILAIQWQWAERLHRTAKTVYNEATRMLDQDARQLRAVAEGARKIYRVTEYHNHLKTIKEEAV